MDNIDRKTKDRKSGKERRKERLRKWGRREFTEREKWVDERLIEKGKKAIWECELIERRNKNLALKKIKIHWLKDPRKEGQKRMSKFLKDNNLLVKPCSTNV